MALNKDATYYRVTLINGQSFLIETEIKDALKFLDKMNNKKHIIVQRGETNPIYINSNSMVTITEVNQASLSPSQSKIWRLL